MPGQSRVLADYDGNVDRYCNAFAFAEERINEGLHPTGEVDRLTKWPASGNRTTEAVAFHTFVEPRGRLLLAQRPG